MVKRSSMLLFISEVFLCKVVLISVSLQLALSFELPDDDIHQDLLPSPHIDRATLMALLEENGPAAGGIFPLSRLGRKFILLPQTLIPYPRAGRMLGDYDTLMNDAILNSLDFSLSDNGAEGKSIKRGFIGMPPRIGRKKRSLEDDVSQQRSGTSNKILARLLNSQDWSNMGDLGANLFSKFEKRPGKSRSTMIPRIGKKRSDEELEDMEKRAMALGTPRIGRAAHGMRMGRFDPRYHPIASRAALIPRIGRRSSSTPQLRRSDSNEENLEENM